MTAEHLIIVIGMPLAVVLGAAFLVWGEPLRSTVRRWFRRGPGDQVEYALTKAPDVIPREPDQAYVLDGVTTAMTQSDWSCGPPYREITCSCGWSSRLAERVLDDLGAEMRTEQQLQARSHYRICEQARVA